MNWNPISQRIAKEEEDETDGRPGAQRDYDRIVFSSALRRLAGKTQVFPMPKNDFVHTRLTHSLEASCIGRSLAQQVVNGLKGVEGQQRDIVWAVSAACLSHDIGNPPFGHAGETAIQQFFQEDTGKGYLGNLPSDQRRDFEYFNGNAFGFHQLAREFNATYGTLAAFAKYPNASTYPSGKPDKFSVFEPDLPVMEKAFDAFELSGGSALALHQSRWRHRSLLALLTEAADDIAYTILDLEDGVHQGMIPEKRARELIGPLVKGKTDGLFSALRGAAVNALINVAAREAIQVVTSIDTWNRDKPGQKRASLLDCAKVHQLLSDINAENRRYCYESPEVLQVELAGFEIIPGLLRAYVPAFLGGFKKGRDKHIGMLVSKRLHPSGSDPYEALLNAVQSVCEMTDRFAFETFQILTGRSLPTTTRLRSSAA